MQKTVFITGGSGGIGSAMVKEFSEAGFGVAFTYKSNKAAAERLTAENPAALGVYCDAANGESVGEAIEAANERFGKIDILINNAGIAAQRLFTDITEEEWDNMIAVNLKSCFLTCKAVLPQMINRKSGVIINVSSMWGICGASCEVHYSAAKSGVIGLTKALAKEVAPSGIRVNCIAPGVIDTPMNAGLTAADLDALREEIPLGSIGVPGTIAKAALFLAGDGGEYITGQVISPNGGLVIW